MGTNSNEPLVVNHDLRPLGLVQFFCVKLQAMCRNPTLAKCGGEAQHLEKVRIWSPPGLPNV